MSDSSEPIRKTQWRIIVATSLLCFWLLGMSLYPGSLDSLLLALLSYFPFVIFLLGIGLPVGLAALQSLGLIAGWIPNAKTLLMTCAMLTVTVTLVLLELPRDTAFACSRSAFEEYLPQADVSEYGGLELKRRLGLYHIDEYAADPRGGVYFRTCKHPHGLSPWQVSHGFAHQPNQQGTPFGDAMYQVRPMGGDWYIFVVSND